jgi:hypothetical protein
VGSSSVVSLLEQVYQFATIKEYSCQKKQKLLNLTLRCVEEISTGCAEKAVFIQKMEKYIRELSKSN